MSDLRARLTALVAEMYEDGTVPLPWADRVAAALNEVDAALLREPPEAISLDIQAGLVEREGAFWKAVLFFADESEARRALDLLNQHAARAAAPEE